MSRTILNIFNRNSQPDDFNTPQSYDIGYEGSEEERIESFKTGNIKDSIYELSVGEVMSIPSVAQAVTDIAETIASLELRIYRKDADGKKQYIDNHFLLELLERGNVHQSGYDIRRTQVLHLLVEGNSFSELATSEIEGGRLSIATIEPSRVKVYINSDNQKRFVIEDGKDEGGINRFFHIAGASYKGLRGWSPKDLHARTFSTAIELDRYVHDLSKYSRRPNIQAKALNKATYGIVSKFVKNTLIPALSSKGQAVVEVPPDIEVETFGEPNDTKSLNQTRNEINVKEIARIFDTPSSRLGNTDSATYNNVLQDRIRFIRGTVAAKVRNIEVAYKRHFLMPDEYIEHDIEPLLRGEFEDQAKIYTMLVAVSYTHLTLPTTPYV